MSIKRLFFLMLYKLILSRLPASSSPFLGRPSKALRAWACRHLFLRCGRNVNIDRMVSFGLGRNVEIGDSSGVGRNSSITEHIRIGDDVMIGPGLQVFASNHRMERTDVPIRVQGNTEVLPVTIENDVWIGANVMILPGRKVATGTVLAAGTVLTKDFPEYSVVGGNPSKLIRSRQ